MESRLDPLASRPFLRTLVLGLLLATILASVGRAEVRHVRLGTRPGGVHRGQSAVRMHDGRFAAVWMQGTGGGVAATAFVQYVDADGARAFGLPGRAVATSPSPLERGEAVIAAHAQEGVLVAVRRVLGDRGSRILVQWLDGEGRARWGRGVYAAPVSASEEQLEPFLLASPDGGAFVCFVRGAPVAFYCQRFGPDGDRRWGTGGARGARATYLAEEPKAVPTGDGGLLVFWRDWRFTGSEKIFLRGQRLGADGGRQWGEDGTVVAEYELSGPLPDIAVVSDGAGGAIVAFDDRIGPPPRPYHVAAQRLSSAGERLWGDGVPVVASRDHGLAALFPAPEGGAFVAVWDYANGGDLAFQRLAADGRSLWDAEGVPIVDPGSMGEFETETIVYGSLDDGVLRLAWDHDSASPPYRSDVRFSAFDAAGNRLVPGGGVQLTRPMLRDDFLVHDFAYDPATDTSFVLWSNGTVAAAVLYSSR